MGKPFWTDLEGLASHRSEVVRTAAARCRNRRDAAKSVVKDWSDLAEKEALAHYAIKVHGDGELDDQGLSEALGLLEVHYYKALSEKPGQ